jgi:hypothetical protein
MHIYIYISPLHPVLTSTVSVFVFGVFVVFVLSLSLSLSLSVCVSRTCIQKCTRGSSLKSNGTRTSQAHNSHVSVCGRGKTQESEKKNREKNRGEREMCVHPTNLVSAMMLGF